MELKIKDKVTGVIYSTNMSDSNKHVIIALNFCTSYTQATVQEEIIDDTGNKKYIYKDLILPPIRTRPN